MRLLFLAALALTIAASGCTTRSESTPVHALLNATPGAPVAQGKPPQNVQLLEVEIEGGKFKDRLYSAQVGAAVFNITSDQGPYTLRVDDLVDFFPVPAAQRTQLSTNLPRPGDYTMRLQETGAFAVLNVREIGGR